LYAEKSNIIAHPLFITVDPARDPPAQLAAYLKDFHPRFTALTGTFEAIKATCKAYRVYFSTPPGAQSTDDYLVDHSIFVYLMDPEGKFVEAFGQITTVGEVVERTLREVKQYREEKGSPA
jgi:protein SCO1/2